ncbi:MAG: type IV toxin-antitoxin system AbiEi family antitoxin domain-containing protein [Kiritimatiellae bacterium]|nr:type IV toxin-antitoxin system AbiEi family antitoxin domain-containing protein [Kiritimatiellia bacterium]
MMLIVKTGIDFYAPFWLVLGARKEIEAVTGPSIIKLAEANGGTLTSKVADRHGVPHAMLAYLVSKGVLCRSGRGVYTLPETMDDWFFNFGNRYRRGVFSHGCALFLFGLTDRTPHELEMTFPRSYNATRARASGIRCHRVADDVFEAGRTEVATPAGNLVSAYSPERTICDVFKQSRSAPSEEEIGALKRFLQRSPSRAGDILAMARVLKVDRTLRPYLEALS